MLEYLCLLCYSRCVKGFENIKSCVISIGRRTLPAGSLLIHAHFFFVPTPGCFKPIRWLSSKRWHIKFHSDPHSNFSSCMIFNSIISWDLEFLRDRATQCAGVGGAHCSLWCYGSSKWDWKKRDWRKSMKDFRTCMCMYSIFSFSTHYNTNNKGII